MDPQCILLDGTFGGRGGGGVAARSGVPPHQHPTPHHLQGWQLLAEPLS